MNGYADGLPSGSPVGGMEYQPLPPHSISGGGGPGTPGYAPPQLQQMPPGGIATGPSSTPFASPASDPRTLAAVAGTVPTGPFPPPSQPIPQLPSSPMQQPVIMPSSPTHRPQSVLATQHPHATYPPGSPLQSPHSVPLASVRGVPSTPGTPIASQSPAVAAAYLSHPKMSVSQRASLSAGGMSPAVQSAYSAYPAPITVKVSRSARDRLASGDAGIGPEGHRGSSASYRGSMMGAEKSPLLPLDRGKGDERERQTARLLFVWLGASTLVLQTTIFITMEDVQNRFFPSMRYAFYAHNVFAFSFFASTAAFACFPARLLFSLRLLSFLNFLAIMLTIAFPSIVIAGQGEYWAFVTLLVLVGCITSMSVLLIPVVFTSASAVPGECAMYAAFGQGLGAVVTALIAVLMVTFLSPKKFLFASSVFAMTIHAAAILSLHRLRSFSWASRRLQRLSDAHAAPAKDDGRRESRATAAKARRFVPSWSGIMKRIFLQLICAFLSTFVSFCVFPAFSTYLGHATSRGFGVAMVAIFHASDQIGRHVPEFGVGLPPLPLVILVLARFAFLPLYASLLSSVLLNSAIQGALGFTHGWAVASAFRYIPAGLTKYEIERVQFYLSLSNAMGIPCGALLMSGLVYCGYFPRL